MATETKYISIILLKKKEKKSFRKCCALIPQWASQKTTVARKNSLR